MINQKVLVIINNHLTNIFKYAFYLENIKKYQNYKFYFLIDTNVYLFNNNKQAILKFINKFTNKKKIYEININIKYEKFFIKSFFNIFKNYTKNKNIIRNNNLKIQKILKENFKEIWIGNSPIFEYLGTNTLIKRFEHAINDYPIFYSKSKNWIKIFKIKLETFINKKLLSIRINQNYTFVTILGKNKSKNSDNRKLINKKYLIKSLRALSINKNFDKKNILINYPFDFIKKKKKINEIYARVCLEKIKSKKTFKSTKTIYLKSKYNFNNIKNFSLYLKKISKKKIEVLNPNTFINIEHYLLSMKPKIIISTFNLGIYIFKYFLKKKFTFIKIDKEFEEILLSNTKEKKSLNSYKIWKRNSKITNNFLN